MAGEASEHVPIFAAYQAAHPLETDGDKITGMAELSENLRAYEQAVNLDRDGQPLVGFTEAVQRIQERFPDAFYHDVRQMVRQYRDDNRTILFGGQRLTKAQFTDLMRTANPELTDTQATALFRQAALDTLDGSDAFDRYMGQNTPVQDIPVRNTPVQNTPVQNTPVQNAPVQEAALQDTDAELQASADTVPSPADVRQNASPNGTDKAPIDAKTMALAMLDAGFMPDNQTLAEAGIDQGTAELYVSHMRNLQELQDSQADVTDVKERSSPKGTGKAPIDAKTMALAMLNAGFMPDKQTLAKAGIEQGTAELYRSHMRNLQALQDSKSARMVSTDNRKQHGGRPQVVKQGRKGAGQSIRTYRADSEFVNREKTSGIMPVFPLTESSSWVIITTTRPRNEPEFMRQFDRYVPGTLTDTEKLILINPNYSTGDFKWKYNCQRCAAALESVERGYYVTAKAFDALDPVGDNVIKLWKFADPKFWYLDNEVFSTGISTFCRDVDTYFQVWGDGARAIIRVEWENGASHVFNAKYQDGDIAYLDSQINSLVDIQKLLSKCSMKRPIRVIRVDNRGFSDLIGYAIKNQAGG